MKIAGHVKGCSLTTGPNEQQDDKKKRNTKCRWRDDLMTCKGGH